MRKIREKAFACLLGTCLLAVSVLAGGPKKIAKSDRSLWPYKLNSSEEFDFASKMEMLVFAGVLRSYDEINPDSIRKFLGLERVVEISINTWKENTRRVLIANFNALRISLPHDFVVVSKPASWNAIVEGSDKVKPNLPDNLKAWFENAESFYDGYIYEQMRLAALFPRTTSEILTFDPSEVTGFENGDKQFLLTFDDGPSPAGGNTDKLIATLTAHHVNGVFFVIGDVLKTRLKTSPASKMKTLYAAMVVGSHGEVHKPHPRYPDWQGSIEFTDNLIDSVAPPPLKWFRPPYGQRDAKMVEALRARNTRVMLWNIDSQDWNAGITAKQVADRVTTLMLLWRRGIILFHDIHSKANAALPAIWDEMNKAGVVWLDAKTLK